MVQVQGTANFDWLYGDKGSDEIYGYGGNDVLAGGAGDDMLKGGGGADRLYGGGGFDTASYTDSTTGVTVNLMDGQGYGGTAQGDVLISIEAVEGSAYDDWLVGSDEGNALSGGGGADTLKGYGGNDILSGGDGTDYLLGMAGDDSLFGGNGADTLNGGAGHDTYTGGASFDTFVFNRGEADGDIVTDFQGNGAAPGDRIELSGYGAGATIRQVDANVWEVTSGDQTTHEFITFSNGAQLTAQDFTFT